MKKEEEMLDKPKIVNIINKELHYLIGIQDLKDLNDDDLSYIAMYLYNDGDMSKDGDINIAALEAKINKSSLAKMKYKYKPIKDIGPNGLRRNEEVENLYNLESDTYTKTDVAHGETYLENYMIDPELKNENDTFIFNCKYVFAAFTDEPEDVKLYYTVNDYLNNKISLSAGDYCLLLDALTVNNKDRLFETIDHTLYHTDMMDFIMPSLEKLFQMPKTEELEEYLISYMVEVEEEHPDAGRFIAQNLWQAQENN